MLSAKRAIISGLSAYCLAIRSQFDFFILVCPGLSGESCKILKIIGGDDVGGLE